MRRRVGLVLHALDLREPRRLVERLLQERGQGGQPSGDLAEMFEELPFVGKEPAHLSSGLMRSRSAQPNLSREG